MNFLLKYRRLLATLLLSVYFIGATSSGEAFMTVALKLTTSASCGGGTCSCNKEAVALDNCCCSAPMNALNSSGGCCSTEVLTAVFKESKSFCSLPDLEEASEEESYDSTEEDFVLVKEPEADDCCSTEEALTDIVEDIMSRLPCDGGGEANDQRFLPKHALLWTELSFMVLPSFEQQYQKKLIFSLQEFIDLDSPIPIA